MERDKNKQTEDYSLRQISNTIKKMEKDLDLLEDSAFGEESRFVWEVSRFSVGTELQRKLLDNGESHRTIGFKGNRSVCSNLFLQIKKLILAVKKSWIFAPRKRTWLVFQHARRKKQENGVYEDIYTDLLISQLGSENCTVIERPYGWNHYNPRPHKVWYDDLVFIIGKLLLKVKKKQLPVEVEKMVHSVNDYLHRVFQVEVRNIITREYLLFIYYRNAYKFMLQLLKPERVLLVVSYGKEGLILAARELGIETIELQHGVITRDHLGYSFAEGTTKKSFPDIFLLFGKFWDDNMHWSVVKERIKFFGYPYYDREKSKYKNVVKKNQVLFISQGNVGTKLSRFAVDFSELNYRKVNVVYKLHPGEFLQWEKEYPLLFKAQEKGIITVVDTNEPALYHLMAESKWQVGVNSTALFEGLAFNCCTYLVNLPGVEYMESLIESNSVKLVNSAEEIEVDLGCPNTAVAMDDFFCKPKYDLFKI